MKTVRYYSANHPMLQSRTGDPARGAWLPKDRGKRNGGRKDRRPHTS